jgi:hypothetical protein
VVVDGRSSLISCGRSSMQWRRLPNHAPGAYARAMWPTKPLRHTVGPMSSAPTSLDRLVTLYRDHAGAVVAVSSSVAVVIRLWAVARFDPRVAYTLLTVSPAPNILVGMAALTLTTVLPYLAFVVGLQTLAYSRTRRPFAKRLVVTSASDTEPNRASFPGPRKASLTPAMRAMPNVMIAKAVAAIRRITIHAGET